ncbi:MAG: sel1 repeat family protein [Alphaproteobacteria bacterium]|nr:sel1 repeat family protein [Alphaproteobacteria bacterium]
MNGKPRIAVLVTLALLLSGCVTNVVADKRMRFGLATAAYDAGDFPRAYEIWSALADEDDLAAMRNTAQMLRQGKGVKKDVGKAFDLYKEAAEKGFVTAMANVAEMYLSGEGTEKDTKEAVVWYARAATAGLSLAQVKLADMYEQGIGVERDPVRARALLERAARNGYGPARTRLEAMGAPVAGTPAPTPADANPDEAWPHSGRLPDAPRTGRSSPGMPMRTGAASTMTAGDLTLMNNGFAHYAANNKAAAFATWRAVAERGNAEAQLRVGLLYESGEGVGQDMIEAYRWLKLAAVQGQPQAVEAFRLVFTSMAPAERAIAESLAKNPNTHTKNDP